MNILLTGGAGYIGSHTIIELDKAGHNVVVVDNLVNSNPESLRRVAKIIGKEIPFYGSVVPLILIMNQEGKCAGIVTSVNVDSKMVWGYTVETIIMLMDMAIRDKEA